MATARIYWTFHYLGDNHVSILNGGDIALKANRSEYNTAEPPIRPTVIFMSHLVSEDLARTASVKTALADKNVQLIDARPEDQFEGIVKAPVDAKAGTLAGAVNLPYSLFLTPGGEGVVKPDDVAAIIHQSGVTLHSPAIVFCNTGHLASSDWFVLHEIMHVKDLRLYTGSMSTWTRDGLPVAAGKPRA